MRRALLDQKQRLKQFARQNENRDAVNKGTEPFETK